MSVSPCAIDAMRDVSSTHADVPQMIPRLVSILQRQMCRPVTIRLLYNISMDHQHRHEMDQMLQPAIPMVSQACVSSCCMLVSHTLHTRHSELGACASMMHIHHLHTSSSNGSSVPPTNTSTVSSSHSPSTWPRHHTTSISCVPVMDCIT